VNVTPNHTEEDIAHLVRALSEVFAHFGADGARARGAA
jgi:5-aminolevulinate synthase